MITALSKKITYFLVTASNTEPDSDTIEIYIYGLECFFNTLITVAILIIWSFLTNTLAETCLWLIVFSILRHHSGGFHAPTHLSCIVSSCILGMSNWIIIMFVPYNTMLIWLIICICNIICILYAPAETSKFNYNDSTRKKEKLYSLFILETGSIISLPLQNKLSISILYANLCVCILLILNVVTNKSKH